MRCSIYRSRMVSRLPLLRRFPLLKPHRTCKPFPSKSSSNKADVSGLSLPRALRSESCVCGRMEAVRETRGHSVILLGRSILIDDVRCQAKQRPHQPKSQTVQPQQKFYLQLQFAMKMTNGVSLPISCQGGCIRYGQQRLVGRGT